MNDDSVTRLMPIRPNEPDAGEGAVAQLVVIEGRQPGQAADMVRSEIRFGRRNDNDLVLLSNAVSKYHGQVIREHTRFYVVDLDSTNGVLVNGLKMEPGGRKILYHGDNLVVGDHILLFRSNAAFTDQTGLSTISVDKKKAKEEAAAFLKNFPNLRRED